MGKSGYYLYKLNWSIFTHPIKFGTAGILRESMIKIISYNLNGIRAAERKGLSKWMKAVDADIFCFQEIKALPEQFDVSIYKSLGYHCHWFPAEKKGYSGVALLSKEKPKEVQYGIGDDFFDAEGRMITATFDHYTAVSVYHPSGSSGEERLKLKFRWMDLFREHFDKVKKEKLIISGDFNICREAIDIHNPKANIKNSGFLPEERQWLAEFLDMGFEDSFRLYNKNPDEYSWWSYRTRARDKNLGWRIDYNLISKDLAEKVKRAAILKDARHSDHAPVLLELLGLH